jgi:hypothetical protein
MKGFKPTGYGPSAGFKFPARFGFTGSTGAYTNVQPYVRVKPRAFKNGGYVSESVPDPGHATVQRSRPYTEEDRESGGKTPLRSGFKDGGKIPAKKMAKTANSTMRKRAGLAKMRKADGGAVMSASPLTQLNRMRRKPPRPPSASTVKEKFAADGGRIARGSSAKGFWASLGDTPKLLSSVAENAVNDIKRKMSAGQRTVEGANESIDERVSRDAGSKPMASNYSRGGKMKRMGYAMGGGVSAGEAKKIAQRTIGEHVRYPAPKGHKGLGKMCGGKA